MKSNNFQKIKNSFFKFKRRLFFSCNKFNTNFKINFKKFILMNWTWPKKVFIGILLILLIGSCLLYAPISYNYESYVYENNQYIFKFAKGVTQSINFLDAFFMSTSAFTNTGLSVIDISTNYSLFGQIIIWLIVQVGGFGFISIFYLIGKFASKVIGSKVFASSIIHIERGGSKISDSSKMIVRLFFIILIIQIVFAFILSGILYTTPFKEQVITDSNNIYEIYHDSNTIYKTYHDYGNAFWHSLFLSSSAINNAGFDLFGVSSLSIFRNDIGILVQVIILILFIIGGIGFPVIYDISKKIEWFWKHKILNIFYNKNSIVYYNEPKPKFSSFTKLCLIMFFIVSISSIVFTFGTEYLSLGNNSLLDKSIINYPDSKNAFGMNPILNKNWAIFFNTMSTRSAGFATVNITNLAEPTRWIFIILMYIGTSPSSTGGGIRVTTLAVSFKSLFYWLRGIHTSVMYKRTIPKKTVTNSFIVIVFASILILVFGIILYLINEIPIDGSSAVNAKNWTLSDFIFECSSAFGTTGLSTGLTMSAEFQWWSYIPLIILMYIGQMGITSTLSIFAKRVPSQKNSKYIEQEVRIG